LKYTVNYDRYFEHSMQGNLSELEFQTAMSKHTNEIYSYILSKNNNIEELKYKLKRINFSSFNNRKNYESYFQALCIIISYNSDKLNVNNNLIELIQYYDNSNQKKLNEFYKKEDAYLDFIFNTLKKYDRINNKLFNVYKDKYENNFYHSNSTFSKSYIYRINDYSIERFNTFIESENSFSWDLWYLYKNLNNITFENNSKEIFLNESKQKIKSLILNNLDSFICNNESSFCIKFCRNHWNNYQFDNVIIEEFFENIEGFIKTLKENESKYLEDIILLKNTLEKSDCADINFSKIKFPRNR
jgi:hypothetical protein